MLGHSVLAMKVSFQTFLECAMWVLPCIEFMYWVSGALVSRALQWFLACVHSLKQVRHVTYCTPLSDVLFPSRLHSVHVNEIFARVGLLVHCMPTCCIATLGRLNTVADEPMVGTLYSYIQS